MKGARTRTVARAASWVWDDRNATVGVVATALALIVFVAAPDGWQQPALKATLPILALLTSLGQWRVAADPRLPAASVRFWRILAVAMAIYSLGMIVDLAALGHWRPDFWPDDVGETLFYPVAGVLSIVALAIFPTITRDRVTRLKVGLDVIIVLFGCATFIWFFVSSDRWAEHDSWRRLADSLVLPALTLVAGFAILRITMAGANVISRPTMICFVTASAAEAGMIYIDVPVESPLGRFSSMAQILGITICVIGVSVQRRVGLMPVRTAPARWRRPFTVLPYVALIATVSLLLLTIAGALDWRTWVVAAGVLAVCAAVLVRQLFSLWENSLLLSANRQLTGRLRYLAYHDDLTALANRTLFTEQVTEALDHSRSAGTSIALLFVDLDDFKIVNDSLGHAVGDQLLVAVAHRLRENLRPEDTLSRLGGDEFAILVEDTTLTKAPAVAQRLIAALTAPFRLDDTQVRVGASIGIAMASGGAPDTDELQRNADVAMYAAKNARKGSWRIFEPTMLTGLLHRHELRAALVHAVERNELVVYYQPIVDLAEGTVHGAEALVRWRRDGALVPPAEFIPLAEETGLIAEIDQWVLREACCQAVAWQAEARPFSLHVNLSARQLHRADLVSDVDSVLRDSGLEPDLLTLEITESGLGPDQEAAYERLSGLARLGVHLAIDDFGTGYSSLAYLRRMPVDVIKIDKMFTDELLGAPISTPLAQAVVVLATALGTQTVAEGIEEAVQAHRLLALGCRYGQGYHYSRPLPAAAMTAFLGAVPVTF